MLPQTGQHLSARPTGVKGIQAGSAIVIMSFDISVRSAIWSAILKKLLEVFDNKPTRISIFHLDIMKKNIVANVNVKNQKLGAT